MVGGRLSSPTLPVSVTLGARIHRFPTRYLSIARLRRPAKGLSPHRRSRDHPSSDFGPGSQRLNR